MDFSLGLNPTVMGGGGSGTVTSVGSGTGLTGGPITTSGTLSLAPIGADTILSNITGSSAAPIPNTLSDILDAILDNSQGDIIYRGASGWTYLPPGSTGQFLQTGGPAADPVWASTSLPFNTIIIYFSKLIGNDANDGSYTGPVATFAAAATLAAAYPGCTIKCLDSQTYSEAMNIATAFNVDAPYATFGPIGNNLIVITYAGSFSPTINIYAAILNGIGSIINTDAVFPSVQINANTLSATLGSYVVWGASTAIVNINTVNLIGPISNNAAGATYYTCQTRSGAADDALTFGTTTTGANGNWNVTGQLVAAALNYPLSDSTAGNVMTTDGAGNLTLQPPGGGGGMTWSTISGTTQAAAVNNGYVVGNALQTTITLPATAAVGDPVTIVGLGAAGWILAANTGQTIQFGATVTSSGGSFTSAAANDNVQVVCTVANTTWAVLSAVSAGLTPA